MFSADTHLAENWMREHYGCSTLVFLMPDEYDAILEFKRAAEAYSFSIFALQPRSCVGADKRT